MPKEIGRLTSVGFGKESTRKTSVAPTYWFPWTTLDIEERVEKMIDETALGVIEDSDANDNVKKWMEFSLETKMKDDGFGLLLLALLGSVSSSVKETTAYNHTFTVLQDNAHPSLTLAEKSGNEDLRYSGCMLDSMEITATLGDYIRFSVGGKGQLQEAASNTVAHTQEYDFKPQDLTYKHAALQSGLDGASEVKIREFNLSVTKNLFDEDVLGNIVPNDFLNQQFMIEGSVTLVHSDATFQDLMLADTVQAMRFNLIGSETIGASSNPELKIDLDKVSISNYQRTRDLNGIVLESFDFKGHYDLTNANSITAILTNEVTSY